MNENEKNVVQILQERIETDKEVLGLLPRNNKKNSEKALQKIEEVTAKYEGLYNEIIKEINARYKKIIGIEEDPEIKKLEDGIKKLEENVILNDMKTSYEKMELDNLIYSINGYYKKELNKVNADIYKCIKKFKEVGIELTYNDFNYSEYAMEYMKVFLEEAKNGDIFTDRLKETFERLYIKCSELIMHISLNIRYLYHKNEKIIDKYYIMRKEQVLREMNISEEQLLEKYEAMIGRAESLKDKDAKLILEKFLSGELILNNYKKDNISNLEAKMRANQGLDEKEFYSNVKKLAKNLYEYQIYTEYKFLVDDIIVMFKRNEKEKNDKEKSKNKKSEYEERIEEIQKEEKKLFQLNANVMKTEKKSFFAKKKEATQEEILERNNQILVLKDLYRKLDNDMINMGVKEKIFASSSILDVLKFATSYYNFIARGIIKKFPEIVEDDINKMIDKLKEFVKLPYFSVINNMNITEVKDMTIIIKDKYKLLGLNVNKEDFEEANIDNLINDVRILNVSNNIKNSKINIDEIEFAYKARDILEKENS